MKNKNYYHIFSRNNDSSTDNSWKTFYSWINDHDYKFKVIDDKKVFIELNENEKFIIMLRFTDIVDFGGKLDED